MKNNNAIKHQKILTAICLVFDIALLVVCLINFKSWILKLIISLALLLAFVITYCIKIYKRINITKPNQNNANSNQEKVVR